MAGVRDTRRLAEVTDPMTVLNDHASGLSSARVCWAPTADSVFPIRRLGLRAESDRDGCCGSVASLSEAGLWNASPRNSRAC